MNRCPRLVVSSSRWLALAVCWVIACVLAKPIAAQGWVDVTPSVPGPACSSDFSAMLYDPARQCVTLFRGSGADVQAYRWTGTQWSFLGSTSLLGGGVRCAVWDGVGQKVLLINGNGIGTGANVVGWNGSTFSSEASIGTPVSKIRAAWDAARQRVVVHSFGSLFSSPFSSPQTLLYDGVSWSSVAPSVMPPTVPNSNQVPSFEYYENVYYDSGIGCVCMSMMGHMFGVSVRLHFEWNGTNWVQRYPPYIPLAMGTADWSPALGAAFGVTFYDPEIGWQPRAFTVANGAYQQVFLTSWPSLRQRHLLAYDIARARFVIHGGSNGVTELNDTWEYVPGPGASYSTFGAGCLGARGVPTLQPQSGTLPRVNTPFTVQANNLPLTGPAFLFFGLSNTNYGPTPLPFDLAPVGAPGCNLAVSGDLLFGFPNILGVGTWTFTVPNQPGVVFYQQAFAFDPAANSLGLTVTNGGRGTVGN
jgi:hypothetical protein